jgi:hypothetical protein
VIAMALVAGCAVLIAWARRRLGLAHCQGKVTLDPAVVARSLREDALQARIERLTTENRRLVEHATLRLQLLRMVCRAHGLRVPTDARDSDLLQALYAVALQHQIGDRRMRHELAARDDALAALGALALHEQVSPGQYRPDELVQLVAARHRGAAAAPDPRARVENKK